MSLDLNVVVVGGGIVGMSAALAMARRGNMVAIIDAGPLTADLLQPDTRVYAINYSSQRLLEQIGVWEHIDLNRLSPYQKMYIWDAVNGAHIDFDSRYVAAKNLGFIVEESVLKYALLYETAKHPNIHLVPNSQVEEVFCDNQGFRVCDQQQAWDGQLLMIADGANSPTRDKLKIELNSWSYDQYALVATVEVEKSHQKTAYQVFLPDGPLAFLPLVDEHHCSIVWSTNPDHVKNLMSFSDNDFNEAITKAFAQKLGQVKLVSSRYQFPLRMRHVTKYAGDCWLLLGDAAHTIHPLAGLGLNIGLADVQAWIRCLDAANERLVSKKSLGAYQRERKYNVWQTILLMEGFKRLFSTSFAPIASLRGIGLEVCNSFTSIKRLFIQQASGIE